MKTWKLHRKFEKAYPKLPMNVRNRFKERRDLLIENPFHPQLNNHSVEYAYPGCRSVNITGDYRVIFREEGEAILFMQIGTHSELYG